MRGMRGVKGEEWRCGGGKRKKREIKGGANSGRGNKFPTVMTTLKDERAISFEQLVGAEDNATRQTRTSSWHSSFHTTNRDLIVLIPLVRGGERVVES